MLDSIRLANVLYLSNSVIVAVLIIIAAEGSIKG